MLHDTNVGTNGTAELTAAIRQSIIAGRFSPGSQMPSFTQMQEIFKTTRGSLQVALNPLKEHGFIRSLPRKGLYVNQHPPHLRRYGLLLPHDPGGNHWSRFDDALLKISHQIQQEDTDGREIVFFTGLTDPETMQEKVELVARQVCNQQFAGLIFTPGTFELAKAAPFNDPDFPKVFIFGDPNKGYVPSVMADLMQVVTRGLKTLHEKKRSRIAVIHLAGTWSELKEAVFEEAGILYHPQWIQAVSRRHPETVERLISLLFDYPEAERPDGLIIADDNLGEYAVKAILQQGLQPGIDLDLVVHCNWPWPVPSVVPMQRIGFHAADFINGSIEMIDAIRSSTTNTDCVMVTALFEEEVSRERSTLCSSATGYSSASIA